MTENDLIDDFLLKIHNSEGGYQFNSNYDEPADRFHTVNIATKLVNLRLVEKIPRGDRLFILTDFGEAVLEKGGWKKHLKAEKIRKKRAEDKERFDYRLAKWKHYTFWPSVILGVIGGVYSIYQLYCLWFHD